MKKAIKKVVRKEERREVQKARFAPSKNKAVAAVMQSRRPVRQARKKEGSFFKTGGQMLGNYLLPGVGGFLGHAAGGILDKIFGGGDYVMSTPPQNNTLLGTTGVSSQVPAMHQEGLGVRVVHREYIADFDMTTAFTVSTFVIDPTNVHTFPWLSQIAGSFQEYEIFGLIFEFKSLSSLAVTGTPGMGSITAAVKYDVYEPAPINKTDLANSLFATSTRPSNDMIIPVECKRDQTSLPRLRIAEPGSGGADLRFSQFGNFYVVTQGAEVPYTGAGEMWCSFDIGLYKPRLNLYSSANTPFAHWSVIASPDGKDPLMVDGTRTNNFGALLLESAVDYQAILTIPTGSPAGVYHWSSNNYYQATGSTLLISPISVVTYTNVTPFDMVYGGGELEYDTPTIVTASGASRTTTSFGWFEYDGVTSGPSVTFGIVDDQFTVTPAPEEKWRPDGDFIVSLQPTSIGFVDRVRQKRLQTMLPPRLENKCETLPRKVPLSVKEETDWVQPPNVIDDQKNPTHCFPRKASSWKK